MPWAVSCCPFGASLGARCCSGRHGGLPLRLDVNNAGRMASTLLGGLEGGSLSIAPTIVVLRITEAMAFPLVFVAVLQLLQQVGEQVAHRDVCVQIV